MKFKYFITLVVIIALQAFVDAESKDYEKSRDECFKELKFTPAEMDQIKTQRLFQKEVAKTASAQLKCYSECFYKKMGMIGADNNFDFKEIKPAVTHLHKGDVKKAEALMEKCKDAMKTGADNCEKAFNYSVCVHDS